MFGSFDLFLKNLQCSYASKNTSFFQQNKCIIESSKNKFWYVKELVEMPANLRNS